MTATFRKLLCALTLALALGAMSVPAQAGFDWVYDHNGSVNDFFEIEAFHTFVTNTGATTDTVMVNMVKNMAPDWVASLCEDLLCYPPFIVDIELILEPGQTKDLIIDITPITVAGKGWTDITLVSKNNPADNAFGVFTVISSGADVLYVSAGGSGTTDALYTAAITAGGLTSATWDLAGMGKAAAEDLARFNTVVWGAGPGVSPLDVSDMTSLSTYLGGGGNLFLSGADLAFSSCDPGSPSFDTTACAWYQNTLGVAYTANTGSVDFVTGAGGDPVFPGSSYAINGGDGSNDNTSPDVIAATGGGLASLSYSGGGTAVVASDPGTGKSIFAGFGFAGISTAASRADFMAQVMSWFGGAVTAAGDHEVPTFATRPEAWPNPFNPQTSIRFEVGGNSEVPATVTVYDVQGRAVRHLFQGTVAPGLRRVAWNGRDDSDRSLAAGVYLARIRVAEFAQVVKMTLAK